MEKLQSTEVIFFFLQVMLLLFFAKLFGVIFRLIKLPVVAGELVGGIILGPTIFGYFMPLSFHTLFFSQPKATIALSGIFNVSVIFMLFIAGLEIKMPVLLKNTRNALIISLSGTVIPFAAGFSLGWFGFHAFNMTNESIHLLFALFLGSALSITSLPVLSKILLDLDLLSKNIGTLLITSASFGDFAGWMLFSAVLALFPGNTTQKNFPVVVMILLALLFAVVSLTVFRYVLNYLLKRMGKFFGTDGAICLSVVLCLLGALTTEYIGIHAIFGAFLMGIVIGTSNAFNQASKQIIKRFVYSVFVPIFWISLGLRVNFITSFDISIFILMFSAGLFSKVIGGFIGAKLAGLNNRVSIGTGLSIHAYGSMEIILGLIALQAGIINEQMFVAMISMSVISTFTAGFFIKKFFVENSFTLGVEPQ